LSIFRFAVRIGANGRNMYERFDTSGGGGSTSGTGTGGGSWALAGLAPATQAHSAAASGAASASAASSAWTRPLARSPPRVVRRRHPK
jgi:hypothetical protein